MPSMRRKCSQFWATDAKMTWAGFLVRTERILVGMEMLRDVPSSLIGEITRLIVVKFSILGVPKNWSNWTPNRMALYAQKKEWLETTIILGRIARVKAGALVAEKGHSLRTALVFQKRVRLLDKDGLYVSCKPLIDGCKSYLRHKIDGKFEKYIGAGLFYDDNPAHLEWEAKQEKTSGPPEVWIEVRIPEETPQT